MCATAPMEACDWICDAVGCADCDGACPLTPSVSAATVRTVMSAKRRVRKFLMNRETRASSQQEPPTLRRPRSMHCTRDAVDKARERIPKSNPKTKLSSAAGGGRGGRSFHIRQTVAAEKSLPNELRVHRSR